MFSKIKSGSKIGVLSPAWIPVSERFYNGCKYFEEKNISLKIGNSVKDQYKYFAGTDEKRAGDLHEMYLDPQVEAIICTRGGWGTLRFVNQLDYELIRANPKPLIGYSDITTIQNAIWHKSGVPSLSGPMLAVEFGKGISEFSEKHFWGYLNNSAPDYKVDLNQINSIVLNNGRSSGTLLGGCLSLVSHLLGTPYCPDFDGAILFLEDVGEEPYKIDRYFAHLKQAGVFDKINGLILGEFLDCTTDNVLSFSVDELIEEYFSVLNIPVIYNFPYGHGANKITMPIGANCVIDTKLNSLTLGNLFA